MHAKREVAPVRERGLKCKQAQIAKAEAEVAPVRERGLKSQELYLDFLVIGRSRKGAWIEIIRLRMGILF